jgi:hypothetical protein
MSHQPVVRERYALLTPHVLVALSDAASENSTEK